MNAHAGSAALVAAAALCGLLATLAGASGFTPRRRARRLLIEPPRRPGRTGAVLARLTHMVTGLIRGASAEEGARPNAGASSPGREERTPLRAAPKGPSAPAEAFGTAAEELGAGRSGSARVEATRSRGTRAARSPAGRTRTGGAGRPRKAPDRGAAPTGVLPRADEVPSVVVPFPSAMRGRGGGTTGSALGAGTPPKASGARPATGALVRLRDRATRRPEVLCVPVGIAAGLMTGSLVPVAAGAAAVAPVGGMLRRRAERAAAERGAAAVSALCGALAGDLRTGRPPHAALAEALETAGWSRTPELSAAAGLLCSAARFGGDVPQALRAASRLHEGMRGLAAVAACWQVAVDGGAGLAAALDRVAAALRAEADQREDLRAQLAGPRSTAVLLALLPLFGVVLGAGLGADPSRVLLHTLPGLACLCLGVALEWAGLAWTGRIIRAAEGGHHGHPKDAGLRRFLGRRAR